MTNALDLYTRGHFAQMKKGSKDLTYVRDWNSRDATRHDEGYRFNERYPTAVPG